MTVSYLMQLTCAPVLNRDENTWSCTLILNVVPLVFPVFIKKIPPFLLHCHLCSHFCSLLLVRLTNFPTFRSFHSCLVLLQLSPFGPHYAKGLDQIILSDLIYLTAVSFLFLQLLLFQLHCQIELSEETAAKFSRDIVS